MWFGSYNTADFEKDVSPAEEYAIFDYTRLPFSGGPRLQHEDAPDWSGLIDSNS